MEQLPPLTPFEEQVLQAIEQVAPFHASCTCNEFYATGVSMCGYPDDWAGSARPRDDIQYPTYPLIDLALGRLAKKGYVEREAWLSKQSGRYQAGMWKLTDGGKLLLGMK